MTKLKRLAEAFNGVKCTVGIGWETGVAAMSAGNAAFFVCLGLLREGSKRSKKSDASNVNKTASAINEKRARIRLGVQWTPSQRNVSVTCSAGPSEKPLS